ncbi:MAG: hypothetical protein CMK32_08200 [Porticoccaceae bacterium]|nr:hypothetical protein [Porticoccaceae bacterium]
MDENHKKFLKHLDSSVDGVLWAAKWLIGKGYDVTLRPASRAPSRKDWKDHADGGDIFIQQRVEVKHLGVSFSGRDDWPFGSKFIVCAKHSFDMANPKPLAYMIVSADKACIAFVKSETSNHWQVETRTDSRYDSVTQEFYLSPLEYVSFVPASD